MEYIKRTSIAFLILIATAVLPLLSGCATPTVALDPTKAAVPAGHGVLVTRVLANNPSTPLDFSHSTLTLQSTQTGEKFTMTSKTTPGDAEALFFGAFPPGRYHIADLITPTVTGIITAPLANQTGEFEITGGRVTDVGALVMAFDSVGLRSGRYHVSIISSEDDTNVVLRLLPSEVVSTLVDSRPLRQDISLNSTANWRANLLAKQRSAITAQSIPSEGKAILFGRSLGVVSKWNPETQKWASVDTGSSFNVRSVAMLSDGSQLIGCEQGVMFVNEGGRTRTLASPGDGAVIFVGQSAGGEYLAVLRGKRGISVFGARGLSPADWHELKSLPLEHPNSTMSSVQTGVAGNRLVLIIGESGFVATTTIHSVDLDSHVWTSYPAELSSLGVPKFSIAADGTLVASAGTAYTKKLYRSTDFGKSWSSAPLENWMTTLLLRDSQNLYVQRIDHIGVFSAKDSVSTLLKSEDGGKTWSPTGELPKFMTALYILPRKGWLAANTLVGDLYVSNDDGKTWQFALMP